MQISSEETAGRLTLALSGRFDFHSHREFRAAYEKALESSSARVLAVNFRGVDYLDSSALGMLLLLKEKAESSGKQVELTELHGTVKQVLDIANFGKLFAIKP
ncbi:MAG: STAS domain-containing protein [Pseudomonadota bacterium]